ncbi:MAG: carbohydrate kinase [Propionibacteriaceae bacterium]|jgi:L-xylulokinase|nr:carbohydrate kinase [Propionibacteriaceae bacterium]
MGEPLAIGLDIGLSTTKAVAFDTSGAVIATAVRDSVNTQPKQRWVEREPETFKQMIFEVLADLAAQTAGREFAGISQAAHGDGVWVLDGAGKPLRPGILSLDSRARRFAAEFAAEPLRSKLISAIGQLPMVSSAGPELRWIKENEPAVYAQIAYVLFPKDMARLWLTGDVAQDYTEVSSGFTDLQTQEVSAEVFELYGIPELSHAVPKVLRSTALAGGLTPEAAAATGLPVGLPVAAGLHDVVAGSVGVGAIHSGDVSVVAGSYCVNQYITDTPVTGDWMTRSFIRKGLWNSITASPSSSTNMDWFGRVLLPDLVESSRAAGRGSFGFLDTIFDGLEPLSEASPYYLPFLYGSPLPVDASAGILGLRSWHTRADTVRAVFEGIALNHRHHLDKLPIPDAALPRIMGGISRNPIWGQMMADLLGREVEISSAAEPGALGVAMAAFVAGGFFADLDEAVSQMVRPGRRVAPGPDADLMEARYARYVALLEGLTNWWDM